MTLFIAGYHAGIAGLGKAGFESPHAQWKSSQGNVPK